MADDPQPAKQRVELLAHRGSLGSAGDLRDRARELVAVLDQTAAHAERVEAVAPALVEVRCSAHASTQRYSPVGQCAAQRARENGGCSAHENAPFA